MKAEPHEIVDHINRNTLDNRKENLRIVDHRDNMLNKIAHKDSNSKYKGVSYQDRSGKFVAYYKRTFIGYFDKEIDAALAYNAVAFAEHGNFDYINKVPGVKKEHLIRPLTPFKPRLKLNPYRGVRRRSFNCFEAYIQHHNKRYVIGYSNNERGAVKLYNDECDRLGVPQRKNP